MSNPPQGDTNAQALFLLGEINRVNEKTQKAQENFGVLAKNHPHTEYALEPAQALARLGIGNSGAGDSALDNSIRAPARN